MVHIKDVTGAGGFTIDLTELLFVVYYVFIAVITRRPSIIRKKKNRKEPASMDYREWKSHARVMYPTEDTLHGW